MNAVEIEEAVTDLAERDFDPAEFPYAFLEAFGNKSTTIKKLRTGTSNSSDVGGVLQRNHIHIAVCDEGDVSSTLRSLKDSPTTKKAKAKFVLATDGKELEAENFNTGETRACSYRDFPNHFGFFLPLAGITTVRQIEESSFDIRATSRFNRLYVELLKENPDWDKADRRPDMNHFMARLIFCFFAEDTDILNGEGLFTSTIEQMSNSDGSNTNHVISEVFRSMNTATADRSSANLPRWADAFPYVNGGLFSGSCEVPKFSRIAQRYLLHIGYLDWKKINPDIFGSMIQAVADDEERGSLGMHYTSVPNILKVLNPLFLDDLREKLEDAAENGRKLLNLRNRMAKIRVFDPACGSGNFLVIAYKEMRAIEADINRRRKEPDRRSDIPLTNFRGIELRDFPAEVARLALIIAEYQCDVTYRGQKDALTEFLPLDAENWITRGNALKLDWLKICPPTGTGVKLSSDDLFDTLLDQSEIDFKNEGGETYICGNPPYLGSKRQSVEQKSEIASVFAAYTQQWKSLDYVAAWFWKSVQYGLVTKSATALVSTNSVCQGQQAAILWPMIFSNGTEIAFAHRSFSWRNLASKNAGVTVVIVGFSNTPIQPKRLFDVNADGDETSRSVESINAYLVAGNNVTVDPMRKQISGLPEFERGNSPTDGGFLILTSEELTSLQLDEEIRSEFIRPFYGSQELIRGQQRHCLWIESDKLSTAKQIPWIRNRISSVKEFRLASSKAGTVRAASWSHRFDEIKPLSEVPILVVPITSSENRDYLPCGLLASGSVISNLAFSMPCKDIWVVGLIASKTMLSWIATVCARMRTDYRFTNTLCWNTFPLPKLTEKNKTDLTRCAEDILLAREAHFPSTIADLYDPEKMPENLRAAHDRNDEVLERIYIGRRFKNDTERLEKLFDMYTKMTTKVAS